MILQYKRLSLAAARVSEISAVKSLVIDFVRTDGYLKEAIQSNELNVYLQDGEGTLKYKLEDKIVAASYEDIVIENIEETNDGIENGLTTIHVSLKDSKLGREEDAYVVIFTK
jgi:hypothetical protein